MGAAPTTFQEALSQLLQTWRDDVAIEWPSDLLASYLLIQLAALKRYLVERKEGGALDHYQSLRLAIDAAEAGACALHDPDQ